MDMMHSRPSGGHLDVLGSIPEQYRDAVLAQCRKETFPRGATLWNQGDEAGFVAFLVRGKAMSTYHSPRGKTGVTGFWSSGDILGAADLGGFDTRQMTVRFLDASTVYTLPLDRFYDILQRFPEVAQQIVRAMSVRLRWVAHLALSLGTHSTEERVRGVLLALVESFGVEHEEGWLIDLSLTHEDLASMVGVSRQFVNGALNHIKQAGLIELGKRRIVVTRLEDLREMSLAPEGGPTAERESTRRPHGGPREEDERSSGCRPCTTV